MLTRPAQRLATLSIATSLATVALKFGAYALTGSVALLSDAMEGIVNVAAGIFALFAVTLAARPADAGHPYGHDKAEYFSSGLEGLLILIAGGSVFYAAGMRFAQPATPEHLGLGLVTTGVATALNFVTARILLRDGVRLDSITLEADARHLMTDVWTSVAIIGGLLLVMLRAEWGLLDPLIACLVSGHIVWTGFGIIRRSVDGLMDSALSPAELDELRGIIEQSLPSDVRYERLRTRKAGARRFIEFVLRVPGNQTVADSHALCDSIECAITDSLRHCSISIHVEPFK